MNLFSNYKGNIRFWLKSYLFIGVAVLFLAAENLTKPDIQRALKTREDRRRKGHIADREERQAFWTKILRGEEKQPAIVGTDAEGNSIVTDIPPKMTDRLKTSELLGRSEADFTDKVAVSEEERISKITISFVDPKPIEVGKEPPKQIPFEVCLPPPAGQI